MKFLYFFFALVSIQIIFFNAEAAQVLYCNNCSTNQFESKVRSQPVDESYYVIDFETEAVSYYGWYLEEVYHSDEPTYILRLSELTVPAYVRDTLDDFFHYRAQYRDDMSNNSDALSELLQDITQNTLIESKESLQLNDYIGSSSSTSGQCGQGEVNVYNFMHTSHLRKQVFDRMLTYYPAVQNSINAWNAFASFSTVNVGPASVSANWLSLPQQITFEDSSHLKVVVSPSGDTFDVVEDSAFDCSDNQVPDNNDDFIGQFVFANQEAQIDFRNYGELYNIEFEIYTICSSVYRVTCVKTGDGKYTCTLYQSSC